MANDTKRIGKKYRILTNAATRAWDVISFWTSSHDVEMDDGTNLQDSLDSVKEQGDASAEIVEGLKATVLNAKTYDSTRVYSKGDFVNYNGSIYVCITSITTPETWTSSHWRLVDGEIPFKFGIDEDGNYGYIKDGADSVTPFRSASVYKIAGGVTSGNLDIRTICNNNGINYSKLTKDNFLMQCTGCSDTPWHSCVNNSYMPSTTDIPVSITYNNSNGTLTYNSGTYYRRTAESFWCNDNSTLHGILHTRRDGSWYRFADVGAEGWFDTSFSVASINRIIPSVDIYLVVNQGEIIDLTQ